MLSIDTETYVESRIQEMNTWKQLHEAELISLRSSINQFLASNTAKSIYTLCTFLTDGNIFDTFKGVPDIAYCIVAATITAFEFNSSSDALPFLYNTFNIEGIINKMRSYRFLILNIEYDTERIEAQKTLSEAVKNNRLSLIAIIKLTYNIADNKSYVIRLISNYFESAGMKNESHSLLELYNAMEVPTNE